MIYLSTLSLSADGQMCDLCWGMIYQGDDYTQEFAGECWEAGKICHTNWDCDLNGSANCWDVICFWWFPCTGDPPP